MTGVAVWLLGLLSWGADDGSLAEPIAGAPAIVDDSEFTPTLRESPPANERQRFPFFLVTAPWRLGRQALGDDYQGDAYFPAFPFANASPGGLIIDREIPPTFDPRWHAPLLWGWAGSRPMTYAWRARVEDSYDFAGVQRVTGDLRYVTHARLGVETSWSAVFRVREGALPNNFALGDVVGLFRFAQSERAALHAGLGLKTRVDANDAAFGAIVRHAGDFFLAPSLLANGTVDVGFVGDDWLFQTRASIGAHWRGWEVFGGYDYLRLGDLEIRGPLLGVHCWF